MPEIRLIVDDIKDRNHEHIIDVPLHEELAKKIFSEIVSLRGDLFGTTVYIVADDATIQQIKEIIMR